MPGEAAPLLPAAAMLRCCSLASTPEADSIMRRADSGRPLGRALPPAAAAALALAATAAAAAAALGGGVHWVALLLWSM